MLIKRSGVVIEGQNSRKLSIQENQLTAARASLTFRGKSILIVNLMRSVIKRTRFFLCFFRNMRKRSRET